MYDNLENNPYDILEVSPSASTTEITKAFGLAMKRRSYSTDSIAKARKILMNPQDRVVADYLLPNIPLVQRFKASSFSELSNTLPSLVISDSMSEVNDYDKEDFKNIARELASRSLKDIKLFEE